MKKIFSIIKNIFTSNLNGFVGTKFFAGIAFSVFSFIAFKYYSMSNEINDLNKQIIKIEKVSSIKEEKLKAEIIKIRNDHNHDIEIKLLKDEREELLRRNEAISKQNIESKNIIENLNKDKIALNVSLQKFKNKKCLSENVDIEYLNTIIKEINNE